MIKITVNESELELPENTNLVGLLQQMKIQSPAIAIEVNQVLVPRNQYASTLLANGDRLEVVTLVGGG